VKAIVRDRYGSPDVLELTDIDKPEPGDDEVLLRVHAASVNPADWHILRGAPYIARMQFGVRKPKDRVLAVASRGVGASGRGVPAVLSGAMISTGRLLQKLGS
jgi:NADPH:quinone reductase-like Zn-dependent oxidoreductase